MSTDLIGAGETYTTIGTWESAIPTTMTEDERGQLKDEVFTETVVIAGQTPGAFKIVLECASGASFKDQVTPASGPLRYNTSNGAGLTQSVNFGQTLELTTPKTQVIGVQIKNTRNATAAQGIKVNGNDCILEDCIVEAFGTVIQVNSATGANVSNTVLVALGAANTAINCNTTGFVGNFLTCVRPSNITAAGTMFDTGAFTNDAVLKNSAVFGFSTFTDDVAEFSSITYCATDLTAPSGTGNVGALTYADQFEESSTASAAHDFRAVSTGDLAGAGVADGSYTDDILDQTRADPPYIGCFEILAAGGGLPPSTNRHRRMASLLAR